jgi:hypothetical protein
MEYEEPNPDGYRRKFMVLEPLHVRLRGDQYVTHVASTVLARWENISTIVEKISEPILHTLNTLIKWLGYFCAQPKQCSTYWI